ncbi:MAG: DUF2007 domain-containing protein [Bacteriovoracaceae bacterium]
MKVLQTFPSAIQAEIVKQRLAANGIEAFISEDDNGGMLPSLQTTLGVKLEVLDSIAKKAEKILEGYAL